MSDTPQAIVLSNDRNPIKADFIALLHQGALHNQLGYMDGKHPETGEIIPLIVGIERDSNSNVIGLWPLGTAFLKGEDLVNYLVPDGNGKYFDQHGVDANREPIEGPDIGHDPEPEPKPKRSRARKAKE